MKMKFKDYIEQRGLNAYRLSKLSGVPDQNVRYITTGRVALHKTSFTNAYKIAKGLGITLEYLYENFE